MMRRRSLVAVVSAVLLLTAAVVAPLVVKAGGGCHVVDDGSEYMEGDGNTVIRMDTCSFAPTANRVAVGTTVRFLNTSTIQHQVVGRSGTWGSDLLDPGQEHSERFVAAGVYPYTCPLHPGMVGAILVGDGDAAGAAMPPAELASSVQSSTTTADTVPGVVVGLAGLGVGLLIGAVGAGLLVRRRRSEPGR
jgi:plastocyanin